MAALALALLASVLDTAVSGPPGPAQLLVEAFDEPSPPLGVVLLVLGFALLGLHHLSRRGVARVLSTSSTALLVLSLLYAAWVAGSLALNPRIAVVAGLVLASSILFALALAGVSRNGEVPANPVIRLLTGWAAAMTVYIVAVAAIAAPLEAYERCILEVCGNTAFYVLGGFLYALAASPPLFAVSAYLYVSMHRRPGRSVGPEDFGEPGLLGRIVMAAVMVLVLYALFKGWAALLVPLAAVVMAVAGMPGFPRGHRDPGSARLAMAGAVLSLALVSLAVFVPAILMLVSGSAALAEGMVLGGVVSPCWPQPS